MKRFSSILHKDSIYMQPQTGAYTRVDISTWNLLGEDNKIEIGLNRER